MSETGLPRENGETLEVIDVGEIQELLRAGRKLLPVGNGTKPALGVVDGDFARLQMNRLSGITEYEPSEFTFTAKAGTPLALIIKTLADKGQYLPFDPPLVRAGATLGGTLASGLSGPGRQRYGGVRDFVLGAHFISGDGEQIRGGGKVVKNAAGFDLPKLLTGSYGRLGVITELTFKVFPKPVGMHSFAVRCENDDQAAARIAEIARGRWELDAIDYAADERTIWLRIGSDETVAKAIANDIIQTLNLNGLQSASPNEARRFWSRVEDLDWGDAAAGALVKVPLPLEKLPELTRWCHESIDACHLHVSVAGNLGWLSLPEQKLPELNEALKTMELSGVLLRGSLFAPNDVVLGSVQTSRVTRSIKQAMDPPGRFPDLPGR